MKTTLFEAMESVLRGSSEPLERARAFAELLAERLPVTFCAVALGPQDPPSIAHAAGKNGALSLAQNAMERAPMAQTLGTGGPMAIDSTLFVPLASGSSFFGMIVLGRKNGAFGDDAVRELGACGNLFALGLENALLADEVERLVARSTDDRLTGAHNRRGFDERLRTDWKRAMRDGSSIALALIDVDHFTAFDDSYGRPRGDDCLRQIARAIAAAGLRSGDYIARFGPQEFGVVMPGAEEEGALALCDRIRHFVALRNIEHAPSPYGIVTVSVGVASTTPSLDPTHWSLIGLADANLQRACHAGRNRVAGISAIRTSPLPAARGCLPPLPHSFSGRARELAELSAIETGWITIAGAPGVGKTALALELARRDGTTATLVELGGATGDEVANRIGDAVRGGRHDERLTLVLDPCDPAIAAVAAYATGLREGSLLRTIATSTQPLRVAGEHVYQLGPMDAAQSSEFLQRCAPQADAPEIVAICAGSPFAIEVAASALYGPQPTSYVRWIKNDETAARTVDLAIALARGTGQSHDRVRAACVAAHAAHYCGDTARFAALVGELAAFAGTALPPPLDHFIAALRCIHGAHDEAAGDAALDEIAVSCRQELLRARATHEDLAVELELAQAMVFFRTGKVDAAKHAIDRVVRAVRTGTAPHLRAIAPLAAANVALAQRHVDDALSLLLDVTRRAREVPLSATIAGALDGYVLAAAAADRFETAARLHAFAATFRHSSSRPRSVFAAELYGAMLARYGLPAEPAQTDLPSVESAFELARTIA